MKLQDHFEATGDWLFKERGKFPLILLPVLLAALRDSEYLERHYGNAVQTPWEILCVGISIAGLLMRALTIGWIHEGTSGRNTKGQLAEALNTDGMYSVVRHPLYFANFLIILGFVLFVQVWWFVLIFALSFLIFYERIMFKEESFLERKFGEAYKKWAERTPLFLPRLRNWKKPSAPFSWKRILKREYSTFLGIILGFVSIKFLAELLGEREFEFRKIWLIFLILGMAVYGALRTLRKKTDWLNA